MPPKVFPFSPQVPITLAPKAEGELNRGESATPAGESATAAVQVSPSGFGMFAAREMAAIVTRSTLETAIRASWGRTATNVEGCAQRSKGTDRH